MDGIVFKIDGVDYPFTSADSLTMDESIILFDYSGLTLDKLEAVEGFNPRLVKAFMHIAVARKDPERSEKEVRELVGGVRVDELAAAFEDAEEPSPPVMPAPKPEPKERGQSSGDNGPTTGAPSPARRPVRSIGTPASDTGQVYVPEILAR